MPPNVREHEGVQPGPRVRGVLQELRAFVDAAARQKHMRKCVLSPGFLAAHRKPGARLGLRLLEQVTLLVSRSEEHTSELQSHSDLVCRLLLEKKKKKI